MLLTKSSIVGIFIISSMILIGLYAFSMNNSSLTLTNSLVVYATTNTSSHSEHMSEMNHNPSNTTMLEEDRKRFCGNDIPNSNLYVKEFIMPVECSQPVGLVVDKDNNIWIASGKSGSLLVFNTKDTYNLIKS